MPDWMLAMKKVKASERRRPKLPPSVASGETITSGPSLEEDLSAGNNKRKRVNPPSRRKEGHQTQGYGRAKKKQKGSARKAA